MPVKVKRYVYLLVILLAKKSKWKKKTKQTGERSSRQFSWDAKRELRRLTSSYIFDLWFHHIWKARVCQFKRNYSCASGISNWLTYINKVRRLILWYPSFSSQRMFPDGKKMWFTLWGTYLNTALGNKDISISLLFAHHTFSLTLSCP